MSYDNNDEPLPDRPTIKPIVTSSVRETDKFRDDAMKMLVKRNQQIAEENEKLLRALEGKNLITYGSHETAALIMQLRDKNKAQDFEIRRLREKLRNANSQYVKYLNKYIALEQKLEKQNEK